MASKPSRWRPSASDSMRTRTPSSVTGSTCRRPAGSFTDGSAALHLHQVIHGRRVVDDDRARRCLGHELVRRGQRDADRLLGREELEELGLVGEVGAGAVAEGVALAALLLEAEL